MKNLKLFVILISLISTTLCNAQSGWFIINSNTQYGLHSCYFNDNNTGYIAGDSSVFIGFAPGIILKTTNGGLNWIKTILPSSAGDVFFTSYSNGFTIGSKTTNHGSNWFLYSAPYYSHKLFFNNDYTGYIVGNQGLVIKTNNSGENWYTQTSGTDYNFTDVIFTDSLNGFIVGWHFNNQAIILKTSNGGVNWSVSLNYAGKVFNSIYFTNSFSGFVVGGLLEHPTQTSGIILKTTNKGNNWFVQYDNIPRDLNCIQMINENTGYIVGDKAGYGYGNIVLKTTNGGINWIEQPLPSTLGLRSVFFVTSETGYITGLSGLILKTTSGGNIIGIESTSSMIPDLYSLSQNYPNPFNPQTKIKFAVPKASFTKLIIYDLLGREVATLVDEELRPGTYEAEWDGSNYSSCVYFYKLISDDFTETKKMVLMK